MIDAEDIKYRNTQFLVADVHTYDTGFDEPDTELRRRIWNVRNSDLRTVMRQFPTDEPLREQCALWIHALVGKHFFPDANHRTAVAVLRTLLRENGIAFEKWGTERLEELRDRSHEVRRTTEPVRLDTLYRRDALYELWLEFFEDELHVKRR
jgi:hypothetical protein